MLNSSDSGGGDSLTLFGSTKHEGLVNLSEALSFSFSLLKPHGELTLGHLEVLDVGGSAIEKRNLAGLLVGDGKRVLEAAVTLPEFVAPSLFRFDTLTADLLPAPRGAGFVRWGSDWLEIVVVIGIRGLGLLLGAIPGHTRWGLSDGVVTDAAGNGWGGGANWSSAAPSRLHAVRRQLAWAEVGEGGRVHSTGGSVWTRWGGNIRSARSVRRVVGGNGHRAQAGGGIVSGETDAADRSGGVGETHVLKAGIRVVSVNARRVHQFWGLAVFESDVLEGGLHCRLQMRS
jgi:hypothetical protein